MVRKLAPKARVIRWGDEPALYQGGLVFTSRGIFHKGPWRATKVRIGCCSNTFHPVRDSGIPILEKALTMYLGYKNYPKKMNRRPYWSNWGRSDTNHPLTG